MPTSEIDIFTRRASPVPPSPEEREPKSRSVAIGIACTLLFHVLLFTLAPLLPVEKLSGTHSNLSAIARAKRSKSFDFQLVNPPAEKPPPPALKFVETNPDAPENTPDQTPNVSNRNQQSAQAEAAKEKDPENRPSVKGRDDIKSDAIVSGERAQPQPGEAATPVSAQNPAAEAQEQQQARAEQIPLTGFDKKEGQNPDGIGTNIARAKAPATGADQLIEGSRDAKNADGAATATNQTSASRPTPRPRPRLTAARSTVLENRIAGTPNVGILGLDARWSEYGDYMNEFVGIIDAQWHKIVEGSSVYPKSGSHVIVTFKLNSDGEVVVQSFEETAGGVAVSQSTSAITTRQPYRKWTEQMIAVLGKEQTIKFGFYYY